ncbi:hypothetical protein HUJ04_011026 [Dendroctonus ponderosae]|nr:hypothetical protein HUJ04_011026 [Dendroctonus ponderosae]
MTNLLWFQSDVLGALEKGLQLVDQPVMPDSVKGPFDVQHQDSSGLPLVHFPGTYFHNPEQLQFSGVLRSEPELLRWYHIKFVCFVPQSS